MKLSLRAVAATLLAAGAVFSSGVWSVKAANLSVTIDGNSTGRVFQGIGGVSAGASSRLLIDYPEPQRSQILDYLFKPNYGASLQDLKVEIGGDVNSTDGSEPSYMHSAADNNFNRGYEWWLMSEAKKRNPNITLSALEWGAPGWIGNGKFYSQDNINYIVGFIRGAKLHYGLSIDYVGIWNETDYNTTWIKNLKAGLLAAGLSTQIVAADQNNINIVNDMLNDAALMSAVDVVGIHYPQVNGAAPLTINKPLWGSEDGPWRGDWQGAMTLAQSYNRQYIDGKITKHEIWSPVTSYYDTLPIPGSGLMYANTPWSGSFNVQPAIWATAQTTQFAQPGWQYLDSASGRLPSGGSYVTLKNAADFSTIIETTDSLVAQTVQFTIKNGLTANVLHVWTTDQNNQFIQQADILPVNGVFTMNLAPGTIYSVTTTSGQSKGGAVSPGTAAFPFPYRDTFDGYATSTQPKYFSDQNGAFEIAACSGGRSGLCLRQAASPAAIPWHLIGPIEPATFLGSMSWRDYQISSDVLFEQAGAARLLARINGFDINGGNVSAYELVVDNTGNWSIQSGDSKVLAAGSVGPWSLNTWHTIKLVVSGQLLQAFVDGAQVGSATDGVFVSGMVGLGTQGWTNVEFDNFSVGLLPGAAPIIPQSQMSAVATSYAPGYEPYRAIDGNTGTFWNTNYTCVGGCHPIDSLPQSITLSLGGVYTVNQLQYLTRQDNNQSGAITSYNIYASSDGTNFAKIGSGSWSGSSAAQQTANFNAVSASYIRLEATAALDGYAAADEINIAYDPSATSTPPVATSTPPVNTTSTPPSSSGPVSFVKTDATTAGNWKGVYGNQGYELIADGTQLPSSVTITPSKQSQWTWVASTADARGLQKTSNSADRIAACWYTGQTGGTFSFAVNATDGASHQLALYMVDWDRQNRGQVINIFDPASGNLLDSETLTSFTAGKYLVWNFTGNIVVTLTNTNGINAVLSGIFLDPGAGSTSTPPAIPTSTPPVAPTSTPPGTGSTSTSTSTPPAVSGAAWVQYLNTDIATGGAWKNVYGSDGFSIPNDSQVIPAYASFSLGGQSNYTWSNNVTDARALQQGNGNSRIASTWYVGGASGASYAFDVNIKDGNTHPFSLYLLDWDHGSRVERIDILDPSSGSVLDSRTMSGFANGTYVTWNIGGHVTIKITYVSGLNAVVSGAFFGGSGGSGGTQLGGTGSTPTSTPTSTPPGGSGNGTGSSTPFLLSESLGTLRSDFGGWVGMNLRTGASPITVTALGRMVVPGNIQSHNLQIFQSNGVPVASVVLSTAGATPGKIAYAALSTPVTLAANTQYYIMSQENSGGDQWYDLNTAVTTVSAATISSAAYVWNGAYITLGTGNHEYVPLDFLTQ